MHIVLIVGGTNEASNSLTVGKAFVDGMAKAGDMTVDTFRLKDMTIEHFTIEKHYTTPPQSNDDYYTIEKSIATADAVVIATPIWNFSIPGNLKNFIDRLGAFGLDKETHSQGTLGGKPFYFILTGGMAKPGWTSFLSITTSHLQEAMRYFGGSIVGTHFEGRCTPGKGVFGLVVDKRTESLTAASAKGEAFAKLVDTFKKTGKLPLKNALSYKLFRFAFGVVNRVVYMFD